MNGDPYQTPFGTLEAVGKVQWHRRQAMCASRQKATAITITKQASGSAKIDPMAVPLGEPGLVQAMMARPPPLFDLLSLPSRE